MLPVRLRARPLNKRTGSRRGSFQSARKLAERWLRATGRGLMEKELSLLAWGKADFTANLPGRLRPARVRDAVQRACYARRLRHMTARCTANPGPHNAGVLGRSRVCSAALRAALQTRDTSRYQAGVIPGTRPPVPTARPRPWSCTSRESARRSSTARHRTAAHARTPPPDI